jgi:hypothetical protein
MQMRGGPSMNSNFPINAIEVTMVFAAGPQRQAEPNPEHNRARE